MNVQLLSLGCATGAVRVSGASVAPVAFNQDLLEHVWRQHDVQVPTSPRTIAGEPMRPPPFDHPRSVLTFILSRAGPEATVYPTERYFYYEFIAADRLIAGNLRFTDIENGIIHVGYFDRYSGHGDVRSATFGIEDGVTIEQLSKVRYRVHVDGASTIFRIATEFTDRPADLQLLKSERFIAGVLDESGMFLSLVFNEETRGFYYILSERRGVADALVPVRGLDERFVVGQRTRFVFFREASLNRLLLVGVRAENVRLNNYYDGPFDQVPPRLPLRDLIYQAYPYTKEAGIDEHGNFAGPSSVRVAISPYVDYETLTDFAERMEDIQASHASGPDLWNAMTYEWKRDFKMPTGPTGPTTLAAIRAANAGTGEHMIYLSQGWPANHHADSSQQWPPEHSADASCLWPPDHLTTDSRKETRGRDQAPAPLPPSPAASPSPSPR